MNNKIKIFEVSRYYFAKLHKKDRLSVLSAA